MRLWTIQNVEAWNTLQTTGMLRADPQAIYDAYLAPHRWMAAQMRKRLGPPPEGCHFPVWTWYRWLGGRQRPDLRRSGHLEIGTRGVLIEIDVDEADVHLSDFELWHYVLNYGCLAESLAEGELFRGLEEIDLLVEALSGSKPVPVL